jgi:hypothetical protein
MEWDRIELEQSRLENRDNQNWNRKEQIRTG